MSAYLCKTTEVYRVDTERGAAELVEKAKRNTSFTVIKSTVEYKTVKSKGEIIDEYWVVSLLKEFTNIKEPDVMVTPEYSINPVGIMGSIPTKSEEDDEE